MNLNTMNDLFVEQLKDVYSAEEQLLKALDKLEEAANHEKLQAAFRNHRVVTEQHRQRLDRVFAEIATMPESEFCKGIKGLIDEGEKFLEGGTNPALQDHGLIAAAQRCEHYEIAVYGTLRALAERLGLVEAAELLEETLQEEKEADELLSGIADEMNGRSGKAETGIQSRIGAGRQSRLAEEKSERTGSKNRSGSTRRMSQGSRNSTRAVPGRSRSATSHNRQRSSGSGGGMGGRTTGGQARGRVRSRSSSKG